MESQSVHLLSLQGPLLWLRFTCQTSHTLLPKSTLTFQLLSTSVLGFSVAVVRDQGKPFSFLNLPPLNSLDCFSFFLYNQSLCFHHQYPFIQPLFTCSCCSGFPFVSLHPVNALFLTRVVDKNYAKLVHECPLAGACPTHSYHQSLWFLLL